VLGRGETAPTLLKCCLIERGIESEGSRQVVPWGASLEEVRRALRELAVAPSPERSGVG
jgi:hypothetical protein